MMFTKKPDKPKWNEVHTRWPVICEGTGKKGQYRGCAAWNDGQKMCMKIHMKNGLCNKSIEDCHTLAMQIRGGL